MKKLLLLFIIFSSLFLTSCIDFYEDIYINKDGSGKYVVKMDMSKLFDNSFIKESIAKEVQKEGGSEALEKDSTMFLRDMFMPGDITDQEMDLIKDLSIKITMSEKRKEMYFKSEIPFKSFEEFDKINAIMSKAKPEEKGDNSNPMGGLLSANGLNKNKPRFTLNKRKLVRMPSPIEKLDDEMKSYMEMMLGDAIYQTTYHLPGKIKSTDIPNSIKDGKNLTIKNTFLDIINGKIKLDGYIKYKRR